MSRITHLEHVVVADAIEKALPPEYRLIRDEACGGNQHIPPFCNDERSRRTEFCNVDLLILREDKINTIVEIEESNVKPTQICGKFLTSALCKYCIHDSLSWKPIEMEEAVTFIQIVHSSAHNKALSAKPEQWKAIENSIRKILPLKETRIKEYWLFSTNELDRLQLLIKEKATTKN
jgi:hypothetical protein